MKLPPEMRHVSVLFCDLVSYTSLSEGLDADEVRELLSGYFEVSRTIIELYGGLLEKFIGDAVMAVWGAHTATESDAERAVRAGLELVDAVAAYGEQQGRPLACRVGIVTGRAAALENPSEGIVVGDRVNTAARIQSAAGPGTVYVDEMTSVAARAAIEFSDAGMHDLKGKAEPAHLWRADRVVGGVAGALRTEGLEARFVGRDAELRLVKKHFHGCADRRAASLVSVIGPAGAGKTRLRWEFERYLDGLAEKVLWHKGRCLPYGDGVAFWALTEMVRQRFGIAEEDPATATATKLHAGLERWIDDADERAFLEARLAPLLGIGESELPREDLFSGWRLFFERLADHAPLVLAVEDVHWADQGLFDFLDSLLDWSARRPIFVLTLARPEVFDRRPDWGTRRSASTLTLDPLSDASMATLLGDLVAGIPPDIRQRIIDRSEGIPLYAVETVRSLIDRALVASTSDGFRVVGDIGDLDVPPTLIALLTARLDRLDPAERSLVKSLAVLGTTFPRSAIGAVSAFPEHELEGLISSLLRKEILAVRSDPLSPDRGQFQFTQNLLRTVAYDLLSRRERKARHLAVAAHLREMFDEDGADVIEVIAAHYDDALLADPDAVDAPVVRKQAADAYTRAGHRTAGMGSSLIAYAAFNRAADLIDDPAARIKLLREARGVAFTGGRPDLSLESARRAYEECQTLADEDGAIRALTAQANSLHRLGRLDEAVDLIAPVAKDPPPDLDDSVTCALLTSHGQLLLFAGRLDEAAPFIERAVILAEGIDDRGLQSDAFESLGLLRMAENRALEATAMFHAASELRSSEDPRRAMYSRGNLLALRAGGDEFDTEASRELLSEAVRMGYVDLVAPGLADLAESYVTLGDWTAAERTLDELRAVPGYHAKAWLDLGTAWLAICRGDTARARAALAEVTAGDDFEVGSARMVIEAGLALAEGRHISTVEGLMDTVHDAVSVLGLRYSSTRPLWVTAADLSLHSRDSDATERLIALLTSHPIGHLPPFLRAHLRRVQALFAASRGDDDDVEEGLRSALDALGELDYPYWVARAQVDFSEWLRRAGRTDEAAALAAAAQATYDRLGVIKAPPPVLTAGVQSR